MKRHRLGAWKILCANQEGIGCVTQGMAVVPSISRGAAGDVSHCVSPPSWQWEAGYTAGKPYQAGLRKQPQARGININKIHSKELAAHFFRLPPTLGSRGNFRRHVFLELRCFHTVDLKYAASAAQF